MSSKTKFKKKNGFVLYIDSRRREIVSAGHGILSMEELINMCSGDWQKLSPEEKQRFSDDAKRCNGIMKKSKADDDKTTGYDDGSGTPPDFVKSGGLREPERQILGKLFEGKLNWKRIPIVICTFTLYVDPANGYPPFWQPAEIGLTAMTMVDGVIDNFARIIDPGSIPKGYGIEAGAIAEKLGLPEIGKVPEFADYMPLMMILENFLQKHHQWKLERDKEQSFYVFAFDSDIEKVTGCLGWLFDKTGIRLQVKVLSLCQFCYLASTNAVETRKTKDSRTPPTRIPGNPLVGSFIYSSQHPTCRYGIFQQEDAVETVCRDVDNYKYFEEQCCVYHMKSGLEIHNCALNMSNRYAFSILEILTLSNNVPKIIHGGHYPDLENPKVEKNRRCQMLRNWGITDMEEKMEERKPPEEKQTKRHVFNRK